jgi:uroporphyrin-III C-methyltransferase
LLTLRALHRLEAAEVVVYDRLVGSEILARIPHGAARFDVGKRCGEPSPTQEINALLLALARTGKRVVRLKGGIPWCSGAVARRRCTWPGTASRPSWCRITAALGCAASSFIP